MGHPGAVRARRNHPVVQTHRPAATQAALNALYIQARAELRVQHYDVATTLLRELLTLDPSHPEAGDLLERATQGRQIAQAYARGMAAEEGNDWATAIREYDAVLQADSGRQDARERREHCHLQQQISDRQAELRYHYDAGNWQAVLDVGTELASLDPASADPDGLTATARERLVQAQLAESYEKARASEEAQDWTTAVATYAQIMKADPAYQDAAARHDECAERARAPQLVESQGILPCQVAASRVFEASQWVRCLAISADGARLATGSWQRVRIWDLGTGRLVWEAGAGLAGFVNSVSFSPDGTRLATGGGDQTARIWDAATGSKQLRVCCGNEVNGVAFSPDGTRLATVSDDRTARIWDAATGAEQLRVTHDSSVMAVAFSPDATRLATASMDNTARIWDAATGSEHLRVAHDDAVHGVAFSPDGTWLATGSDDKTVRVTDAASGAG